MSLFEFGRLIYRNAAYLVVIPILLAALVIAFTHNQKKQYASSALIYTGIASGFNIESDNSEKVDYHAVNNAFDNLITIIESKQTIEEVLLRLLAHHIYALQNGNSIPLVYSDFLTTHFTPAQLQEYKDGMKVEAIYLVLQSKLDANDPLIVNIIRGENGLYTPKLLSSLEAKRHKSSDMLKLYFVTEEPIICKQVVELMIEVFGTRYKAIKVAETGDVVAYFQKQLDLAKDKLNTAEDRLTDFRTGQRVINYGEQTKAIAIKQQNALEEYSNKKMNLLATQVALNEIESKLKIREDLLSKNNELLEKRDLLASLVQEHATMESTGMAVSSKADLQKEIDAVKKGIQADMEVIFSYSNSKEGLPSRQLLNEWLENVIVLNREKANVDYYKNRLDELDDLYDTFAPLGSVLARLEREISVAEREYLEILNGLNMSKLRQQNIQLSSQIETVDWPQLPTQPLASKRKLLVISAFLFGLVSILSFLVAREMLDNSLSTPTKAEKASKLELIGAFPIVNEKFSKIYPDLLNRIKSLVVSKLMFDEKSSKLITVFSAQQNEGKTTISRFLADELQAAGFKTRIVAPANHNINDDDSMSTYEINSKLNQATCLEDLNIAAEPGYTILELPALTNGRIPYELIKTSDAAIMIARADRAWTLVQSKSIKDLNKKAGLKPVLILNGVKPFNLVEFIGEIGTKHNFVVTWLRKVARFELGNSAFNQAKS